MMLRWPSIIGCFAVLWITGAHAQQSQVFPPSNPTQCPEGSVLTWAGSGTDVACRGLSATCLAIMQGAYGNAPSYNFYPELVQRNVAGVMKWVPSGNWECKLLSSVPIPEAPCVPNLAWGCQ